MNEEEKSPRKVPLWLTPIAVLLTLFVVAEVNYPHLTPQTQLAGFAMLGLVLCFGTRPLHPRLKDNRFAKALDLVLIVLSIATSGWVVVHSEPAFESLWIDGQPLGNRAGSEEAIDYWIGGLGLLLILESTRRSIGWALPLFSLAFVAYGLFGSSFPEWLFPHRGYDVDRIVSQTFLQSQGVFGTALRVMFTYVFLFVVFGALLKQTGATEYIIQFAQRVFRKSPGGPAKVAVLSSGLMGSLSGSAVANTATTGTFTIPLMRSSGFRREIAAGVEAAASSGGALVPPVMGAGAYMMLEIVDPPVTYLQIVKAALIPALLYYLSLILIVHFYARRIGITSQADLETEGKLSNHDRTTGYAGLVFLFSFATLISLLLSGYTVIRSVSYALIAVILIAAFHKQTRVGLRPLLEALRSASKDVVPLISAAACVGIIMGIVTLTGIGSKLPSKILTLSEGSLLPALLLIMISSIVLGMGLPSAVCYLLMATLIGPALGDLGVVPLSAHLFIFYFGMMSMVTPPVALAAYTAGTIANASIMKSGLAAFRFALVGFTLPFMFVFRPELLMLSPDGSPASFGAITVQVLIAVAGITALAAGIAGHGLTLLQKWERFAVFVCASFLLLPAKSQWLGMPVFEVAGIALFLALLATNAWRARALPAN